jgi:hypothetical protein
MSASVHTASCAAVLVTCMDQLLGVKSHSRHTDWTCTWPGEPSASAGWQLTAGGGGAASRHGPHATDAVDAATVLHAQGFAAFHGMVVPDVDNCRPG